MPLPNVTAGVPTTLQLGYWRTLDDTFQPHPASPTGTILNLNDGSTWSLVDSTSSGLGEGLQIGFVAPEVYDAGNPRTIGRSVTRRNRGSNMEIRAHLMLTTTSWSAFKTAMHNLVQTLEGISQQVPAALAVVPVQSSTTLYADVLEAHFPKGSPAYKETLWNQLLEDGVEVIFTCRPQLRGARQYLSNLVPNPGFGAPMGGGLATSAPIGFADPFSTVNAYTNQTWVAAVKADSPVAYWRLNDRSGTTAVDSSAGAANPGTYTGTPNTNYTLAQSNTFDNDAASTSVLFDGTAGYVNVPFSSVTNPSAAWTYGGWAYPTGGAGTTRPLFGNRGSNKGIMLYASTANVWALQAGNGASFTTISGGAATLSTWAFVVATYDGTNVRLYVNGSLTAGPTACTFSAATSVALSLGRDAAGAAFFAGDLEDLFICNTALSAGAITTLYTAGAALSVAAVNQTYVDNVQATANGGASLVRYYRLDEASGTAVYDLGGSGQTGTTHGSPTLGVAGLLTGDTDTCMTFAAASSQYISAPTSGLPTGNAAWSYAAWFKFAANPAANTVLFGFGNNTSKTGSGMWIDTSGKLNCDVNTGTGQITSGAAVTTGTAHLAVVTWDGTTLTLYLDGASTGTPTTPGALAIAYGVFNIGANPNSASFWTGQLDEVCFWKTNLSGAQVTALYNAGHTGASGTLSNALSIPNGTTISFGSPAWSSIELWQVRFKYVTSLTLTAYLHRTDANNYLAAVVTGTALTLNQVVGGVTHQLATATGWQLTYEGWYWLQVTQFPASAGVFPLTPGMTPYVQATLLYDSDGSVGSQVASGQIGGLTFDAVTALSGIAAIAASGAALVVGGLGNSSGAGQEVNLWGPGGWLCQSTITGTGVCAGCWDQTAANAAPLGLVNSGNGSNVQAPVSAPGTARFDLPPAGTIDCGWRVYTGSTPTGTNAIPLAAAGQTVGVTFAANTTGLNAAHANLLCTISEYDSNGNLLRTNAALTVNPPPTTWTAYYTTWTTGASTAYLDVLLRVQDLTTAGESAGGTVWFDNVQLWNVTTTGQSTMPYCELRFPNNPARLLIGGIQGDVPPVATLAVGTYIASWSGAASLALRAGLRPVTTSASQLVGSQHVYFLATQPACTLDSASYGGYYLTTTAGGSSWELDNLGGTVAQQIGQYEMLARVYSTQSTGNIGNVSVTANTYAYANAAIGTVVESWGASMKPLSAGGSWQIVDLGHVYYPPTNPGGLADLTQSITYSPMVWTDTTGGGSAMRANWFALLPLSSNILLANVQNPSSSTYTFTTQWMWLVTDATTAVIGNNSAWMLGLTASALPIYGQLLGNSGSNSQGYPYFNPVGDNALTLQPRLSAISGQSSGTNELVVTLNDNTNSILAIAGEIIYSPLYLFPL